MKAFLPLKLLDVVFIVKLLDVVFIVLINVKMSTIVGILTFMGRINFALSRVEHGKSFITSGTGYNTQHDVEIDLGSNFAKVISRMN